MPNEMNRKGMRKARQSKLPTLKRLLTALLLTILIAFLVLLLYPSALFIPSLSNPASARGPISTNHPSNIDPSSILSSNTLTTTAQASTIYLPVIFGGDLPIGSLADGWVLMLDDEHIASRSVPRLYHPFQKYEGNPIMVADRSWEGNVIQLYGTVLPGFRMWYSSFNNASGGLSQVLYAESTDGIHWRKPKLFGAAKNALFGGQGSSMASVLHTPLDSTGPYKLMTYQNNTYQGYWSINGLDTVPFPSNPFFNNRGDVAQFYWDPVTQIYGGTIKELTTLRGIPRRMVRFISSHDFNTWVNLPVTLQPDQLDDQLYPSLYPQFYGLPFFRMGDQLVGLLWFFQARDLAGLYGRVNIQLVSSHDGINWIREEADRPPILDTGLSGAWDGGQIYTATSPIRVGDELWLYYSGCNLEHGSDLKTIVCGIGLAKAGYHRLASLSGTGYVLTQNLTPSGSALFLNYEANQGSVQVELQRNGVAIPGYEESSCTPLVGDSIDEIVSWSGLTKLPAGPFQIKYTLDNSSVYAYIIK